MGATELLKADDEQLKLDLKMKNFNKVQENGSSDVKNVFKSVPASSASKDKEKEKVDIKRKVSALEEIMEQGKKKKALDEIMEQEKIKKKRTDEHDSKDRSWLRKFIVVKVVTKSLGDKYYKKKGYVNEVIDDFAALVVINETGAKVKLDRITWKQSSH